MTTKNRIAKIRMETAARIATNHARAEMQCREIERLAEQLHTTGRNITANTINNISMTLKKIKFM